MMTNEGSTGACARVQQNPRAVAPPVAFTLARFRGSVEGMNNDLRYPTGKFVLPDSLSAGEREEALQSVAELPEKLRSAVHDLSQSQIETPYREGGWSVRQTVHHAADSHMQAFSRLRLALTEDWPVITPYRQNLWAEL